MNKAEFVDKIVEVLGAETDTEKGLKLTKAQGNQLVDRLEALIVETVKSGDKIALAGFGSFEKKHTDATKARNPRTGASVDVPAKDGLVFHPAAALKKF